MHPKLPSLWCMDYEFWTEVDYMSAMYRIPLSNMIPEIPPHRESRSPSLPQHSLFAKLNYSLWLLLKHDISVGIKNAREYIGQGHKTLFKWVRRHRVLLTNWETNCRNSAVHYLTVKCFLAWKTEPDRRCVLTFLHSVLAQLHRVKYAASRRWHIFRGDEWHCKRENDPHPP